MARKKRRKRDDEARWQRARTITLVIDLFARLLDLYDRR